MSSPRRLREPQMQRLWWKEHRPLVALKTTVAIASEPAGGELPVMDVEGEGKEAFSLAAGRAVLSMA